MLDFLVQNNKIAILLNQFEAEKSLELLNVLFNNMFHKNGPFFVRRLLARPLMATTHVLEGMFGS